MGMRGKNRPKKRRKKILGTARIPQNKKQTARIWKRKNRLEKRNLRKGDKRHNAKDKNKKRKSQQNAAAFKERKRKNEREKKIKKQKLNLAQMKIQYNLKNKQLRKRYNVGGDINNKIKPNKYKYRLSNNRRTRLGHSGGERRRKRRS